MRRKVATVIEAGVPAHALAPLMRQLRDLDKAIRALDAASERETESAEIVPDEALDASDI